MNNLKKGLSLFLAALFVMVSTLVATPVKAEELGNVEILPEIEFAVQAHYPLYVGENQSVYVKSNYEGQVQYRAFLKEADGTWSEVTEGYTEPVDANEAYPIVSNNEYKAGDNYFVVWVKRAGVEDAELANNTAIIKESEIPALKGQKKCYDNFAFIKMTAVESEEQFNLNDVEVKFEGTKVSVVGNEEVSYAIQARNLNAVESDKAWLEKAEYTKGSAEREFAEGNYLVAIWASKSGEGYPDAYKLVAKNIETAKEITAITTKLDKGTFGGDVTVALTDEGKEAFKTAVNYSVFAEIDGVSTELVAATAVGEKAMIYPAEADMDIVVKLLDANKAVVAEIPCKLGQEGKVVLAAEDKEEENNENVDYSAVATLVPGTFGGDVTVTTENEGVAKYRVLGMINETLTELVAPTAIGQSAMIYPAEADQAVTVELLNAEGTVLGTVETTLVVAK